ncbi:11417_t:CDS:2 [Funneliformis geosporum]|uniref:13270_t:CDS:1 n=1 Tax=Funneliformis geosporum TaxID=1117311 RepID=A0A9W4SVB7_9GLOM|nr:13270_t:CDS:2 [Funneliformis geosporum]CAI2182055.1 11417_t:CDS:2 [Funneliformis geosporum]
MEKQKYLYKNSKCVGGTSSTVSLINAWISITGQRNLQKYRSIAYLGGFTIIAFATIWFLSQSPTYKIEYDSKEKSEKSEKSNKKSDGKNKPGKHVNTTNKKSVSWWSAIREKITSKLGFGRKSKSQKNATKFGKPSSSRSNSSNGYNKNKSDGKKRISGLCGSGSDTKSNSSIGSSYDTKLVSLTKNENSINKKVQDNRIGSGGDGGSCSSNASYDCMRQKVQINKKIRNGPCGVNNVSINNTNNDGLQKKDNHIREIQVGLPNSNLNSNSKVVKQQPLRKLKLNAQGVRSSNSSRCYKLSSRNVESRYWSGDHSTYKHSEKTSSTRPIHDVKCPMKSLCQDMDNRESSRQERPLTDLEMRITDTVKKINSIELQVGEKDREFYIPYEPLTLHETSDQIAQERVERYKKLLVKLKKQNHQDLNFEFTLEKFQEYFHEKKYYVFEDDDDNSCKRADQYDEYNDFLESIQTTAGTKITGKENVHCDKIPSLNDVLAQDEQASKRRIERNFEILKMLESYQQQSKETEANIKKSIEMFHEQNAQCKGATRHLKRPSRFHDEFDRFEDRMMDVKQQAKYLTIGLDDMDEYFKEILELSCDDDKMDIAVTKHGSILIDDD